jgi:hypothetical protein
VIDNKRAAWIESKRADLADEESHYNRIKRVFGTDDGIAVAQWILQDLCRYWIPSLGADDLGRYNVGRVFIDTLAIADIGICHRIFDARRELALRQRKCDLAALSEAERKLGKE